VEEEAALVKKAQEAERAGSTELAAEAKQQLDSNRKG
jgi:hypothetical protein